MKKGFKMSQESREKMRQARLGKPRFDMRGENNPAKRPEIRKVLSEQKLGEKNPMKRIDVRKKVSDTNKRNGTGKWNEGIKRTLKQIERMRETALALNRKGSRAPNWRGGLQPENAIIRNSFEMKIWRKSVFERDDYTCVLCGIRGVTIHADHIKPFALYPELRLILENGRTLCVPCHRKTDTYGGFKKKKKELCL